MKIVTFPIYAIAMSAFVLATCAMIFWVTFTSALVGSVQWCLAQHGWETGENMWTTWKVILRKSFKKAE